jgi:hypothetical protein
VANIFLQLAIYFFGKVSRVTEGKEEEVTKGQSNFEKRNKNRTQFRDYILEFGYSVATFLQNN